jgi:hypothetical protein
MKYNPASKEAKYFDLAEKKLKEKAYPRFIEVKNQCRSQSFSTYSIVNIA